MSLFIALTEAGKYIFSLTSIHFKFRPRDWHKHLIPLLPLAPVISFVVDTIKP